ncbi:hypothetical protein AAFF_G00194200 [Aldrovandia affinis]|uniref:CREG-like beta-barrel domain-containing protein n=1 Tax=Aldrovandia affinis TaxID=143900 RepID=A0AAD7WUZ4_9TELE|nr:hypothetical protein AAFF_G00194200 [Aldrovandia affinis]
MIIAHTNKRSHVKRDTLEMKLTCNMAPTASLALAFVVLLALPCDHYKIPPHEEVARVARFVANQCDWASMATISTRDPVKGQPFSNAFSVSDGPVGYGTGVPYMYLTNMEISVQDLQVNPQASLSMSLAQTDFCKNQSYDPQSPLCAHIIFSGTVLEVNGTEAEVAKKSLFGRHPEMVDWPADHGWFFAKMNITQRTTSRPHPTRASTDDNASLIRSHGAEASERSHSLNLVCCRDFQSHHPCSNQSLLLQTRK